MAGTPDFPTTSKAPGLAFNGAGLGPGAGTLGALTQEPLWQPSPQCLFSSQLGKMLNEERIPLRRSITTESIH